MDIEPLRRIAKRLADARADAVAQIAAIGDTHSDAHHRATLLLLAIDAARADAAILADMLPIHHHAPMEVSGR